jgi:hypothetical protein
MQTYAVEIVAGEWESGAPLWEQIYKTKIEALEATIVLVDHSDLSDFSGTSEDRTVVLKSSRRRFSGPAVIVSDAYHLPVCVNTVMQSGSGSDERDRIWCIHFVAPVSQWIVLSDSLYFDIQVISPEINDNDRDLVRGSTQSR